MSELVDYYEVLQVHPKASQDIIAKAYKTLIYKHHPDRGGDEEVAKRITGAYWVLSDPSRRAAYDEERKSASEGSRAPHRQSYAYVENLPPEAVDAILAATLMEMTAATVRTVGRVAGSVVVAGAGFASEVAGGVASDLASIPARRREAQDEERRNRDREERIRREERTKKAQRNERIARTISGASSSRRGWRPGIPSKRALKLYSRFDLADRKPDCEDIGVEELAWLSVRHRRDDARSWALSELALRCPSAKVLAGKMTILSGPTVLSGLEPSSGTRVEMGLSRAVCARPLTLDEFSRWQKAHTRMMLAAYAGCTAIVAAALYTFIRVGPGLMQ